MNDFLALPARELAARMARRELSVQALVRAYIARIDAAEAGILAWQHFDGAQALQQARQLDAGPALGALHGLPIGVKDLMDTADMPTTYGSPIYAGHRPVMDAACVAMARAAGAVVMGKTVTTEFATFQPGPTRNPRAPADAPRTPGGSSSGSAAAVAAGMVPIAFGTQTAGSIIRPAAYCGVVGYKPTFGTLPSAGIKSLSPSLDTVGVLARCVDDAAFFIGAMARLPLTPPQAGQATRLRVGICRTPHWERAGDDSRRALDTAARWLEGRGAVLSDLILPAQFDELTQAQIDIMAYEAAAAFAPEMRARPDGFSSGFAALLAAGRGIDGSRFFAAQALAGSARRAFGQMFDSVDIVLAPSAPGEAPAGLGATGDPMFNRMWTLLGNPCVHVPTSTGAHGMPVGVTLIGPCRGDARVLAAAQALERCVA
ncbi:amidase [Cupriavidus basilensis]|uniref:Putative amidase n=1 Tax=Cupriavidus basilensis TaxID=68895 RepID=A0A0C4YAB8_9BURK|nr:amidase [Cupriavidus basilensis]AJG17451.1 putative amidase [Cupriavidus basilensis]